TVINPGGSATSVATFAVMTPPTIAGIVPLVGGPGTVVTIRGRHLAGTQLVTFAGVSAGFPVASDSVLRATAPAEVRSGPIAVTNAGGPAVSAGRFIARPVIAACEPTQALPGRPVRIVGYNFADA